MTKKQKPNRTQINDLKAAAQELAGRELAQVQGGATNLNSSRTNPPLVVGTTTTVSSGVPPAPVAAATSVKSGKSNTSD